MADWDKAKAAALKVLGDKGEVPDLPPTVFKMADTYGKANDTFKSAREECESKLLDIENALSALSNAIEQFMDRIEKSDFKLDPKNKDDAKKIKQAQKILTTELTLSLKDAAENDKTLKELDKHLIQLGKYKASTTKF